MLLPLIWLYFYMINIVFVGNLSPVKVETTPHLTKDGKSKSILLEATMSTGCRHGTIAPILMKDDKIVLLKSSACTTSFDNNEEGMVSCTTDIPESVWKSVDRVITELQPNNDLPSNIKPNIIKTSDINFGGILLTFTFCRNLTLLYMVNKFISCQLKQISTLDVFPYLTFYISFRWPLPYIVQQPQRIYAYEKRGPENHYHTPIDGHSGIKGMGCLVPYNVKIIFP